MSRKRVTIENDERELRKAANLSQAALGTVLGVSRQTINTIETGRYDPSPPLAFVLAMPEMILIGIVVLGARVSAALQS